MKKLFVRLFGVVLILSLMAGCSMRGRTGEPIPIPSADIPEETSSPAPDVPSAMKAAHDRYPADTTVMTVNGQDVSWGEYFYWLSAQIGSYYDYTGAMPDWEAAIDESETMDDRFRSLTEDTILTFAVTETKARDLGLELSAEVVSALQANWDNFVQSSGGEEAALSFLEERFLTKDIYEHFSRVQQLYSALFGRMFGENGDKLSEAEVLDYAEGAGYMRARHILFTTANSRGEALSAEEKALKFEAAESTLSGLQQVPAGELDAKFTALMNELSEDPGKAYYPDGYCFAPGEMAEEFETAVTGLSDGELSGIVESRSGYHIILRLPLQADAPSVYDSGSAEPLTLRFVAANGIFVSNMQNWMEEAEVTYGEGFRDFRVASLFR